jgi:ribose transport system substrate-binding protein
MAADLSRRDFVKYGGVAGVGLLAGCAGDDGGGGDGDGGDGGGGGNGSDGGDGGGGTPTVAFSVPSLEFTFFARMQNAFNAVKSEDGISGQSTFYDAGNNQSKQISDLETAISSGVDFIMVSAITTEGIVPAVEQANDADIPVVAIDRNITQGETATYVASDNVALGRRSTELCLEFLTAQEQKDSYNVIQLEGTPGASVTNDRTEGFEEAVSNSDALTALDSQTGEFSTEQALSVTEDFITNYGSDIDGIYAQNDLMALGAHRAVSNSDIGPVPITGIDGTEAWVQLFADNQYYGTIAQLPEEMVRSGIEKGKMALAGESLEDYYQVDGLKVTQENAQGYLDDYF